MAKPVARLNWGRFGLYALSAICLLAVVDVLWNARLLRPIADDYAAANNVIVRGLAGYIGNDYLNFSGELSRVVADAVLVGVPVTYLPWSLGSASSFFMAALVASLATLAVTAVSMSPKTTRKMNLWLGLPVVALTWWAYWWAPVITPHDPSQRALPEAITHWQIINSSYVVLPALVIALFVVLSGLRPLSQTRVRWLNFALLVVGVVAGLTGPVFGLTAAIAIFVLMWMNIVWGKQLKFRSLHGLGFALIGLVVGVTVTQASPGTRGRAPLFRGGEGMVPLTPGNLLNWTIPQALYEWADRLINTGSLVTLLVTTGLGFLLSRAGWQARQVLLVRLATGLLGFSLVFAVVNRFSEAIVYPAFWHQVGFSTVIFLAVSGFGLALGNRLATFKAPAASAVVTMGLIIGLLWAFSAERILVGSMSDRYQSWLAGPAPRNGIPDIEQKGGGFERFWLVLAEFRGDAPDRVVN
jgi:hypothetical protein